MIFNSFGFLIFLPIVFVLYWFVFNRSIKFQNIFIVIVSYFFYGWWDWRFLLLIAFTSACSYFSGILIERYDKNIRKKRAINVANICVNLSILVIFKYYDFFIQSFAQAFNIRDELLLLNVILPVGISFYTFQALSYSIDVYRKKIKPTHSIVNLFAYVSFFPQLVAGPIERATNLLPQFERKRSFDRTQAVEGCRQILWGFFKKIAIADLCANNVNIIFENYATASAFTLILGAILFSFQIYGDFSGYSDIAIGSAKLFGFELMQNFRTPYFSRDIAEFWRRWHISLTSWFRDYVYIPLGGSRCSKLLTLRNTIIVFLVSGLWHGANWTYLVWGGYHAILFISLLLFNRGKKNASFVAENKIIPTVGEFIQMFSTFILVSIGWVIFRAGSIEIAYEYLSNIVSGFRFNAENLINVKLYREKLLALALLLLIILEWLSRSKKQVLDFSLCIFAKYRALRWGVYYLLILFILYCTGPTHDFIYFQF